MPELSAILISKPAKHDFQKPLPNGLRILNYNPGDEKQQQLVFSTKVAFAKQHWLHSLKSHFVYIADNKDNIHRSFGKHKLRKQDSNGFEVRLASFQFIHELSRVLFYG